MKIQIILPIKEPRDILISQSRDYLSKLRPPICAQILFLNCKKKSLQTQEIRQKSAQTYKIALNISGKNYSSRKFTQKLESFKLTHSRISFLIGDADGLSQEVLSHSDEQLSLSSFTLPHRIALLVLCEQLYRASEITYNTPYHK